jgi:hypothetical protein
MAVAKPFGLKPATTDDADQLATLHTAVAAQLTQKYGKGPWSSKTTEKGVLYALRTSRVLVARERAEIVGTLQLTTKKPWAIDTSYFSECRKPLYLVGMAVAPGSNARALAGRAWKKPSGSPGHGLRMRFGSMPTTPLPGPAPSMPAAAGLKWAGRSTAIPH